MTYSDEQIKKKKASFNEEVSNEVSRISNAVGKVYNNFTEYKDVIFFIENSILNMKAFKKINGKLMLC